MPLVRTFDHQVSNALLPLLLESEFDFPLVEVHGFFGHDKRRQRFLGVRCFFLGGNVVEGRLFLDWLLVDGYLWDFEGRFFLLDRDERLEELLNDVPYLRLLF